MLVTACAQATGGAGTTRDGAPVAGHLLMDPANRSYTVTLTSPGLWICESTFPFAEATGTPSMTRNVPLSCGNRLSGTLIFTGNQFADQVVGSFRLSDGTSGQVTFGRV